MKQLFTSFLFFVLISPFAKAQDTIVLNSGQKVLAKHIHIRKKLYYKDYPSRMPDSMEKAQVNYVIHQSGWKIPIINPPWLAPITISPGIGLSAIMAKFHAYIKDTGANIISFSPVYSLNIDYAPLQNFSIGIGVAWQSLSINPSITHTYTYYSGYTYSYVQGNPNPVYKATGPYTVTISNPNYAIVESLTRLNIGVRAIYHIRNDDIKDFYLGVRVGLSMWTDQSNPAGTLTEGNVTLPSIQALIGFRREIMNRLGAYLEAGLGSPYFANAGLYYKVNTVKKQIAAN